MCGMEAGVLLFAVLFSAPVGPPQLTPRLRFFRITSGAGEPPEGGPPWLWYLEECGVNVYIELSEKGRQVVIVADHADVVQAVKCYCEM